MEERNLAIDVLYREVIFLVNKASVITDPNEIYYFWNIFHISGILCGTSEDNSRSCSAIFKDGVSTSF